jgi:hypothetical protein
MKFDTTEEIVAYLDALPVGSQFVEVGFDPEDKPFDVVIKGGKKRFRSPSGISDYGSGAWDALDEIVLIKRGDGPVKVEEPNLYEKVEALRLSTIFRVGAGDPFVRTRSGVATIMGVASELPSLGGSPTPKGWATHEVQDITIIWEPRS